MAKKQAAKKSAAMKAEEVCVLLSLKHPRVPFDLSAKGKIQRHADNTRRQPLFDRASVEAYMQTRLRRVPS